MTAQQPVHHLSTGDAYQFLSTQRLGRLAIVLGGEPEILPINFRAHLAASGGVTIYIHTDPGNKLFAAAAGKVVALEADEVTDEHATSVVAYGQARIVRDTQESGFARSLEIRPWVSTYKAEIIAIDVERLSGRRFALGPEPENPTTEVPG